MAKKTHAKAHQEIGPRYGIAEWYGKPFALLSLNERKQLASKSVGGKLSGFVCPFMSTPEEDVLCNKRGGVCTMRLYRQGSAQTASPSGPFVTMCPSRFEEDRTVYTWIGSVLLGTEAPLLLGQVGFLKRTPTKKGHAQEPEGEAGDVGRIDNVLVHPDLASLRWCALEMQAVYFSGDAMTPEFKAIRRWKKPRVPFPVGRRRPDFRSSGPKRLMPQLQTKVPTLRRWGKKMAVVVDRSFFNALGPIESVTDVSNCDIAWFVVKYQQKGGRVILRPDFVKYTELESSVKGLTCGRPATLEEFEKTIREKAKQNHSA